MTRYARNIFAFFAPWLEFKRSLFWGVIGTVAIIVLGKILGSLDDTVRAWWGELFSFIGLKFYPGLEIPLTLILGIPFLGRLLLVAKKLMHTRVKLEGTFIVFERYGVIVPGIVRATLHKDCSSDFPYDYVLHVFPSIRYLPEPCLVAPDRAWVVLDMSAEEFVKFYASSCILVPEKLPKTIRWDKWAAEKH